MSKKHCKFLSPALQKRLHEKRRASQSQIDYFDNFNTYNQKNELIACEDEGGSSQATEVPQAERRSSVELELELEK